MNAVNAVNAASGDDADAAPYRVFDDGEEAGSWAHELCARQVEEHLSLTLDARPSDTPSDENLTCLYCGAYADEQ